MLALNEKRGIEERYESATNTSNLTLTLDPDLPGGAADVLIAAGWSDSRLGGALMRLHSQWATSRPVRQTARSVKQFQAVGLKQQDAEAAHLAEQAEFDAWYMRDMRLLVGRLKDLPAVREQLALQAVKWKMADAGTKAAAVIRYWLDQNCGGCNGRKFQLLEGTPGLSNRVCKTCRGSGVAPVPFDQDGRKLANHMDACVHRARQGIRNRLRGRNS